MRKFNELNIRPSLTKNEGEKIKVTKILNQPIIVNSFKIETSKFAESGYNKCLHLFITYKDEKRLLFSGSKFLVDAIQQVPDDAFPFETIIVENNDRHEFT